MWAAICRRIAGASAPLIFALIVPSLTSKNRGLQPRWSSSSASSGGNNPLTLLELLKSTLLNANLLSHSGVSRHNRCNVGCNISHGPHQSRWQSRNHSLPSPSAPPAVNLLQSSSASSPRAGIVKCAAILRVWRAGRQRASAGAGCVRKRCRNGCWCVVDGLFCCYFSLFYNTSRESYYVLQWYQIWERRREGEVTYLSTTCKEY